jgi:GDP-L-fucose synthase
MFFNLVRCKGHFGKMIYFGSGAEFGREHWKPNMAEDYFDVHVPSDQYGFSKYLMTKYAIASDNIYNLRLFGVFGKYDDWRYRFIPNICARIALDLPLAISQNRAVDLLYVDDLVKMTNWLLKAKNAKKVYNACSGRAQDYLSLVDDVLRVSGKKADLTVMQNGIGREYSGDSSLILKDSGITLTPMPQALGELYNWYCINPGYVDKEQILNYPL